MSAIVYAGSDLHGRLPSVPADADVLLLAGDICPDFRPYGKHAHWGFGVDKNGAQQYRWLDRDFREWLSGLVVRDVKVVACWGNHDFVGENADLMRRLNLPWTLLQDSETVVRGVRVYGTPWVPGLPSWAFHARDAALLARSEAITDGIDVLMTHGPPYGQGDFIPGGALGSKQREKYGNTTGQHVGDPTLNDAIKRVQPKAVVCGHIHEARGTHMIGETPIYNVAAVDEAYNPYPNPFRRLFEV